MHLPPLDVAVYPIVTMGYGSHSRAPVSPPPSPPPGSPSLSAIQRIIRSALQSSASIQQLQCLPCSMHRVYLLTVTDGTQLVLKTMPPPSTRLLRLEQHALESEARLLTLIASHAQTVPVPRIIKNEPRGSNSTTQLPYLLRSYMHGTPLSQCRRGLHPATLAHIQHTLDAHIRALSVLNAPAFGSTHRVFSGSGYATWQEAFVSLLESALRDAEDMLVGIPYETIRAYVNRFGFALNDIRQPLLVPLGVTSDENVLVNERTGAVVGMIGFKNCFWGDPALAEDFVMRPLKTQVATVGSKNIRRLLYGVYQAVIAIVAHYYRPRNDEEELQARRHLTRALNQLATFP